MTSALRQD